MFSSGPNHPSPFDTGSQPDATANAEFELLAADSAIDTLLKELSGLRANGDLNSPRCAVVMHDLGLSYMLIGQYHQASLFLADAWEVCGSLDPHNPFFTNDQMDMRWLILKDLCVCYGKLDDLAALLGLAESLSKRTNACDASQEELAQIHLRIAGILTKRGQDDAAQKHMKEALLMAAGQTRFLAAHALADSYLTQGRVAAAASAMSEAVKIAQTIFQPTDIVRLKAETRFAGLCFLGQEYPTALSNTESVLARLGTLDQSCTPEVAHIALTCFTLQAALAEHLPVQGDPVAALSGAINDLSKILGNTQTVVQARLQYAWNLLSADWYEPAEVQARILLDSSDITSPSGTALYLLILGRALFGQNKLDAASQAAEQGLAVLKSEISLEASICLAKHHGLLGQIHFYAASAHRKGFSMDLSLAHFAVARSILDQNEGHGCDSLLVEVLQGAQIVLEKLGRKDEAAALQPKLETLAALMEVSERGDGL